MGLKKLCLTAGLMVLGTLVFAPGALAWTFSASGSATCDTAKGEQVITWSIDNRTEPEKLTIRDSNRSSVAVGSTVAARSIGQFTERVAGSTTGTVTLTVKGNWPSDQSWRTRSASVTLSAACHTDVCPNLTGVQQQVPSGLIRDAAGNCVPVDECPNITGVQSQVPSGLVKDAAGNCVKDECPNIAGVQQQVPSGLIKDAAGNCVPPDECPNLAGAQQQVPSGLIKDAAGNCVPPDECPNIEGVQTKLPDGFVKDAAGNCICHPHETIVEKVVTVEKVVQVPGPERVVTVAAAPKIVTKIVIKRVKVAIKKVKKAAKRKQRLPRVLPFTR